MDIHHLKIFISVYKNRSFSKAANELLLTQPTISEHIKFLENYLNKKLFDRIGRQVYPTEQARILYSEAKKIVEEFENLKSKLTNREEKFFELEILSSSVPGNYILPKLINKFNKNQGNIVFSLKIMDSQMVYNKIINDDGYIGFVGTKTNNISIEHHQFLEDEIVLIAEKNFECPGIISIKDIQNFPLILREIGSGTRREVEYFLEKEKVMFSNLKINFIFDSNEALKQSVLAGGGLAFISKYCIQDEISERKLKIIKIKEGNIKRHFYWIKKKGRTLPPVTKSFIEFISKTNFD